MEPLEQEVTDVSVSKEYTGSITRRNLFIQGSTGVNGNLPISSAKKQENGVALVSFRHGSSSTNN